MLHQSVSSRSVLLCAVLLILYPVPVLACSKPEERHVADPWFIEDVLIDTHVNNPAVQIKATDGSFPVHVRNTSDAFLYILMADTWETCDVPGPLPQDIGAVAKVSATQTFYCTYDGILGRTQWRENPQQSGSVELTQAFLYQLAPDLPNLNQRADHRPTDVRIPPDQQGSIRILYDDRSMSIPITVTYRLNPKYDPYRYATATQRVCGFGNAVYLVYALAGASIIGFSFGLWMVSTMRNQPSGPE